MKRGFAAFLILLLLCGCCIANAAEAEVKVLFVNIGDGDAILVQKSERHFLIDTGRKQSANTLFFALEKMGVHRLDGVLITHSHKDHLGGLKPLRQLMEIEKVYAARIGFPNREGHHKIQATVEKLGLPLVLLDAGDKVPIDETTSFEVLGPLVYDPIDDNDNSLVLRLAVLDQVFLFTGDMQFAEEKTLLDARVDLKADVLKVGNHGNPDATSKAFARAVSPKIAVISTNTKIKKKSANPRVLKALSPAEIYVTQEATLGILVTLSEGELKVTREDF